MTLQVGSKTCRLPLPRITMKRLFKKKRGNKLLAEAQGSSTNAHISILELSTPAGAPLADVSGAQASQIVLDGAEMPLPNTSDTYKAITDWLEQGFALVRDVSEATPVLAPLKSASVLVIRALQILRVRTLNERGPECQGFPGCPR